jgi:outer membrane protein assembly factor BamA
MELAALHATAWNYTRDSIRLRAAVSRQFGRRLAVSFFGSVSADSASGGGMTEEELGPSQYQTASGGGLVSLDFRDSPLVPRRGWFTSAELEAGNAAVPFVRGRVRFSWYQPISGKLRVAANWQAGAVAVSEGIRRLPLDQRVFNGGASTVRSFGERELGPQSQGGTPLGGSLMQAANAEISWEFLPNLEAALFADAGSLAQSGSEVLAVPDDLRYAVGLGLRYALPVGPLRLDYGFNPDRRDGEPSGAFHATFGYAF